MIRKLGHTDLETVFKKFKQRISFMNWLLHIFVAQVLNESDGVNFWECLKFGSENEGRAWRRAVVRQKLFWRTLICEKAFLKTI